MQSIFITILLLISFSTYADTSVDGKSPLRDAGEGVVVAGGGAYAFVSAGLGGSGMIVPIAMVSGSGAMGYGVGKIIRSIDAVTGKNIHNLMYWIGDKSGVFKIIYENTNPSFDEVNKIFDEIEQK